jgi:CRISPR-associated exonuclease Cas4
MQVSLAAGELLPLTVTDVRQHMYCPRIPFFHHGLRLPVRPVTFRMQEGRRAHEEQEGREARRTLHAYGLTDGERHFGVQLRSARLGLAGKVDLVIVRAVEVIPVEWKDSEGPLALNHKYQLTAYALLCEEAWRRPARRAFVYWLPRRRATEVPVTPAMRRHTRRVLGEIRAAVASERMPPGTRQLGRCRVCEFLNWCNDRW